MAIDRFYAVGFVIAILFSLGLGQNQTNYTKPSKPNLFYQTYQTKSKLGMPKLALSLAQLSPIFFFRRNLFS